MSIWVTAVIPLISGVGGAAVGGLTAWATRRAVRDTADADRVARREREEAARAAALRSLAVEFRLNAALAARLGAGPRGAGGGGTRPEASGRAELTRSESLSAGLDGPNRGV